MIKSFSIETNSLKRGDSLVPEFYYYANVIEEENKQQNLQYVLLGTYFISDGEHSAIPRNSSGGIRYLYGRNIREGLIDFDPISDVPYIDVEDYLNTPRTHISENDVLVPIVGTIGKSAIYKEEYVGLAGIPRHIAHITIPKNNLITPEYLTVFFRSKYGKIQLYSLTTGNIQPLLSLTNLKQVKVPIINNGIMENVTKNESLANQLVIESQKKLQRAKDILYNSLGFDIKKVTGDFSITVSSNTLFKNDIWTPNHYNTLYDKINKELKTRFKHVNLNEICLTEHGVEVGSDNYNEYLEKDSEDVPFIRTSDIINNEVDLYPDFYVPFELAKEITKVPQKNDVIFTKDGKIGAVAMITENDNCILSSGVEILRLNGSGKDYGITPEYLFLVLSIKEIGYYEAIKRTVVASTIPHLRPERLREIEIPIIQNDKIIEITKLVREAFDLKNKRKPILKENDKMFESYFC